MNKTKEELKMKENRCGVCKELINEDLIDKNKYYIHNGCYINWINRDMVDGKERD